jgi:hydroxymethylpyrimidine pyrophosphatase-like HAD family hydrolase
VDLVRTPRPATELLVALDVDGTILHHDGHLSERVADAVRALDASGARVMLATGRSVVATMPVLQELGMVRAGGYAVCSNGAITIALDPGQEDGYRIVDSVTFDPRPAVTLLRREIPGAIVAVEEIGVGFKLSAPFPDGELQGVLRVVDLEELVAHPATRVTVRNPAGTAEEFAELVERIGLHGVNYAVGFTAWLDLAPEGVSKASALEQVRRKVGIEPACTVAVGDQRNDLEMLRWAARGVSMGQAPQEVHDAADETTGPVEADGLAEVLEGLLHAVARS